MVVIMEYNIDNSKKDAETHFNFGMDADTDPDVTLDPEKGMYLSKMIASTIRNKGFRSFMIIGDRNIGKSTYALVALHEAFLILGDDEITAWTKALSCIKFNVDAVTSYLNKGVEMYETDKTKLPALCWDDLRKYASALTFFSNRELYGEISGLLDTIKIPLNVFIGTCPSVQGIMNIIRSYDGYQINIGYSKKSGRYRDAKCYLWKTSPMGQKTLYPKWVDTFFCRLPNWVWKDYELDRVAASKQSIAAVARAAKNRG